MIYRMDNWQVDAYIRTSAQSFVRYMAYSLMIRWAVGWLIGGALIFYWDRIQNNEITRYIILYYILFYYNALYDIVLRYIFEYNILRSIVLRCIIVLYGLSLLYQGSAMYYRAVL